MQSMKGLSFLLLCAGLSPPLWAGDDRASIRSAVDHYFQAAEKMRNYTVERETERREFNADGQLKSHEQWTHRYDFVQGVRVGRTVGRDGGPLTDEERAQTQEAMRKAVADWKRMSESDRQKILSKQSKELEYLREFPDALNFKPLPPETVNGRQALGWSFEPRPGYKPKQMAGRVYEGVRGTVWLDRDELHLVRMDAEVFRDVSVGGFLAKIEKGTRFALAQIRVEPGVWLPEWQLVRFDVRVLLVKNMHKRIESRYRDWKRYTGEVWRGD